MQDPQKNEAEPLVAELYEAARRAGLRRDDPLAPLIRALGQILRYMSARTAESDRVAIDASQRIVQAVSQSQQAAEALTKVEADTVSRISAVIAETVDAAWTRRVRKYDRNTALLAAVILFLVAAACLAGGAWWGHSRAYADIHETEDGLRQAFSDGPDMARSWRELMEWNDLRGSIRACKEIQFQDGREWCGVPLWLQKPTNPQSAR
jgi:hypothetical protein